MRSALAREKSLAVRSSWKSRAVLRQLATRQVLGSDATRRVARKRSRCRGLLSLFGSTKKITYQKPQRNSFAPHIGGCGRLQTREEPTNDGRDYFDD